MDVTKVYLSMCPSPKMQGKVMIERLYMDVTKGYLPMCPSPKMQGKVMEYTEFLEKGIKKILKIFLLIKDGF